MFADVRVALPASVRGPLYLVFSLLGLAIGATWVGYAAAETTIPQWLTVSSVVFSFVGTAIGWTAASNTADVVDVELPEGRWVDDDGDGQPDVAGD